jgi:hypothetical protein
MSMPATSSGSNNKPFNGVKVFSATMAQERDQLGEKITSWLSQNQGVEIVDKIVTQSSDEAFHCLAITLFFNTKG